MRQPTYTPAQMAEVLNVPLRVVREHLIRDVYTAVDLWSLRSKLGRFPCSVGTRRQLFLNLKGGTGKTSLSTSYAFRLAEMGYCVLLVDLDSQGHATKCLGYEGESFNQTLHDVLVRRVAIEQVVWKTPIPNLDFIPSNLSMSSIDLSLMPLAGREVRLRNAMKGLQQGRYDFVIFDAPPSFGLLNLNAVLASDDLIAPVLADFLSFHGLGLLFDTLRAVEVDFEHRLDQVFVVANAFNSGFRLAKEALEALQQHYAEYLLPTVIRQCSRFAQASSDGVPIFLADRDCRGAQDVQAMVHDVLLRLMSVRRPAPSGPVENVAPIVPLFAAAR